MSREIVLPYKLGSDSAEALARGLGIKQMYPDDRSKFVARGGDIIINWGNSAYAPPSKRGHVPITLNRQAAVRIATDKLETFRVLEANGVNIPRYHTSMEGARKMLQAGTKRVFVRKVLNGHSGTGIVVARAEKELVQAPLYVEGIAKDQEFRVHVMGDKVIDYAEKCIRNGARESEEWNADIRSHDNGWVFVRDGVTLPKEVAKQSIKAVAALGLDFGAVDICTQKKTGLPKVLEVNTAPGLEGTTLERYVAGMKDYLKNVRNGINEGEW